MTSDTLGFVDDVAGLPEQLTAAHDAAAAADLSALPGADDIDNVVVLGVGGSGIAGDVIAAVGAPILPVPLVVAKGYDIPAFVGPRTLAMAVSYSGASRETLAMTTAAADAGAHVVGVSSGGALEALVAARGGVHHACPPGHQPRAALGALVAPLLVTLFRMGLLPEAHAWLVAAQQRLATRRESCHPDVMGAANPARELARRIGRTVPLVYGAGGIGATAAWRWKCDVNENAKAPAFASTFPELDHNEICGWGQHGDITRQVVTLVQLRHDYEDPRLDTHIRVTLEIIEETLAGILEVRAEGTGPLAQLLDLMYLGDWVSVYLAFDNDVDPGPVDAIDALKSRLG